MTAAGRWADLRARVLSAAVMIAVAAFAVWQGGAVFLALIVALTGGMIWELARMTALRPMPSIDLALGGLGAASALATAWHWPHPLAYATLLIPPLALILSPRRDRAIVGPYALALMIASAGFITLRDLGVIPFLWLILVVVASDTLGYFAGRLLGGPKFWPAISPKKTWSGTIAGWAGAGLVGLAFWAWAGLPLWLMAFSPFVALAGQFGDIAESWIKRRAGVKDTSNFIPGHGGLLDRFDAFLGAMLAVQALVLLGPG